MDNQFQFNDSKFMEMINFKINEMFLKMLNNHLANFSSIIMKELNNIKSENDIVSLWNKNCSEPLLNIPKKGKEVKENKKCCFILNKGKNKGNECGRKCKKGENVCYIHLKKVNKEQNENEQNENEQNEVNKEKKQCKEKRKNNKKEKKIKIDDDFDDIDFFMKNQKNNDIFEDFNDEVKEEENDIYKNEIEENENVDKEENEIEENEENENVDKEENVENEENENVENEENEDLKKTETEEEEYYRLKKTLEEHEEKRKAYQDNHKRNAYDIDDYILTEEELKKVEIAGEKNVQERSGENEYFENEDGMMESKLTKLIKPPKPEKPITDEIRRKRWEATLDKKTLKSKKEDLDAMWKQKEEERLETIVWLNEREERERQREILRLRMIPKSTLITKKLYEIGYMRQRFLELEKKREEAERLRKEEEERKERAEAERQFKIYAKFYRRKEDKEGEARREARRLERFINGESSESSSSSDDEDYHNDSIKNGNFEKDKKEQNDYTNCKSTKFKKNIRR